MGKLNHPLTNHSLKFATGDSDGDVRISAVDALAGQGKTKWKQWIKGDKEDFARMGKSGHKDALEKALAGAFSFYRLADQRDAALFQNTRQRLLDRHECKAVLITGGYHTEAIMRQVRQQGHSYVALRPAKTRAEASAKYFELLRSPEQPTEFERLLASRTGVPASMAVRNFLTLTNFRFQFKKAVGFIEGNMVKMRNSEFLKIPDLTLERIRGRLIKIGAADGSKMGMLFNRQSMKLLPQQDMNAYLNRPSVLNSTQLRIAGLWIVGGSILAVTILPLLGLTAAAYPALGVLGLALVGLWWLSGHATSDLMQRVLTPRHILLGVLAVGAIALPILSLPLLAEVLYAGATPASGVGAHLAALAAGVDQVMGSIPWLASLTPVAQDPSRAAVVFQNTSSMISSSVMGVVMGALKFANLVGNPNVRQQKTTEALYGKPFTAIRAEDAQKRMQRQVREKFGEPIEPGDERPWKGAFVIMSEEKYAAMLHLLSANGLRRFSDRLSVDLFTYAVTLPKDTGAKLILATPIAGEPHFSSANQHNEIPTFFRIVVRDPQFLDDQNQPLYKEIPDQYTTAVLNTLNPAAVYRAYKHRLPEMLKRAGDFAGAFEQILKISAEAWERKKAPTDFAALQEYVGLGFLHEAAHALALHLPDEIPQDLLPEEREHLEAISLQRYLDIINDVKDKALLTSVVFTKNLIKALEKVEKDEPSRKTQSDISVLIALEMFCDRFSMYLYENYLKIELYNEVLREKIGYPITIDSMLSLERSRRAEETGMAEEGVEPLSERAEVRKLSAGELSKLKDDLKSAEQEHVYIRKFGDPMLKTAERDLFEGFLDLLKHFDDQNKIMRFTMQHADTSRFMHATASGKVSDFAIGMATYVRENVLRLPGVAALAVGIVESLRAPEQAHTVLDMDIEPTQEQVDPDVVEETAPETLPELPDLQLTTDHPSTGFTIADKVKSSIDVAAVGVEEPVVGDKPEEGKKSKRKIRNLLRVSGVSP
ncbi:MAG: hypothetical protein MIO92_06160 [Methanosarcinaceae archaeon]|nr:hypothetical protein [Methanosarcinaceae archaeon]